MTQSKTTVNKSENDQYQVTIPKALAEGLDLENGDKVEWKIQSGSALRMQKSEEE